MGVFLIGGSLFVETIVIFLIKLAYTDLSSSRRLAVRRMMNHHRRRLGCPDGLGKDMGGSDVVFLDS